MNKSSMAKSWCMVFLKTRYAAKSEPKKFKFEAVYKRRFWTDKILEKTYLNLGAESLHLFKYRT